MRRLYGASPLHLAGHLAFLALAGYVLAQMLDTRAAANVILWLVAAVVLHDLVLLPLYSLADRALPRAAVNHLRVPLVVSGLLLLVYFPMILGRNEGSFARVAGETPAGYLGRWLAVTAALFLASGLLYAVRHRRRRRSE